MSKFVQKFRKNRDYNDDYEYAGDFDDNSRGKKVRQDRRNKAKDKMKNRHHVERDPRGYDDSDDD